MGRIPVVAEGVLPTCLAPPAALGASSCSMVRWPAAEGRAGRPTRRLRPEMGMSINGGTPIAGWLMGKSPLEMDEDWG